MSDHPFDGGIQLKAGPRTVECDIYRDADLDRPDVTYWRAVPREHVEKGSYEVLVPGGLPPHQGFWVDIERPGSLAEELLPGRGLREG